MVSGKTRGRIGASLVVLAALIASAALPCTVTASERPTDPWKAIWISRFEYKTREDVATAVANAAKLGCRQILFQVRGNADAYYVSAMEPWGSEIGGQDPGFDPLAVAISEARRAGIELHAWVNVVPGWRGATPPADKQHVYHRHPEWFLVDQNGAREALKPSYYVALNPFLPEVRAYVCEVLGDLCKRYALDGLHLDYIRFLERAPGADYGYDARTLALYRAATGKAPKDDAKAWDAWRRSQITAFVREIRVRAKHDGRALPLSAAVLPERGRAHALFFQDYAAWVREGLVDRVLPMNYRATLAEFEPPLKDLLAHVPSDKVTVGIGIYKHADPKRSVEQILRGAQLAKGGGIALFSYENLWSSPNPEQEKNEAADLVRARRRGAIKAALKAM